MSERKRLASTTLDPLVPSQELDHELGQSAKTSQRMRERGQGPEYVRIGRRIFYRRSAIERWLAARTFAHRAAEAVATQAAA